MQNCLERKQTRRARAHPDDPVVWAPQKMRDHKVRAVLVLEDETLVGSVTQGDGAIKALLPGRDATTTRVREAMTRDPMTVRPSDPLEACMGLMAQRGVRHLPVIDAGRVVGVVSIGDVVKDHIRLMGQHIGVLETCIKGHGA